MCPHDFYRIWSYVTNTHKSSPVDEDIAETATLTGVQHEALTEAFEHGYFEIPRNTDRTGLADLLNITHQALSELLRRGSHDLTRTLLVDEGKYDPDGSH